MNNTVTSNPLYYEKPYKLLFKYATPSIISMLVGSLYNIVDQIFIGQGVGINGNAATNVAFPLSIICMSIALFHGFGSASMYSILLGQGNNKRAATIIGNAVVSAFILGFIFTIIVKLFNKNFMTMFGSTKEVLPYAIEYTNITVFGFIPFIFSTMMSHIIRADGSPKYSMMSVLSGAIVNTILDPILIFKFDMGMSGAALATIIGQFISFAIVFRYLFRFKHITFERDNFKVDPKSVLKIFSLGSSSGFNQLAMMAVQITMNNVLSYRDFSLSFLFDFRYGGYAANKWLNPGTEYYNRCNQLDLPYWTPENPLNDRPSVGYSNPRGWGFYESLTYLRLQDVSLSYNIPSSLTKKILLNNVKVYVSGKNLATWTGWHGWDPEHASGGRSSSNGPLIKSWVFGLQISL